MSIAPIPRGQKTGIEPVWQRTELGLAIDGGERKVIGAGRGDIPEIAIGDSLQGWVRNRIVLFVRVHWWLMAGRLAPLGREKAARRKKLFFLRP